MDALSLEKGLHLKCPFCGDIDDRVVDSRSSSDGAAIRRRRECQHCKRRYTTYERIEETPRLVIKKDRRREPFSRQKVLQGLLRACEKRPVPLSRLEELVDHVEQHINESFEQEVESHAVGQLVTEQLKQIDQVAFVRFASVYQEFSDVTEFLRELKPLLSEEESRLSSAPKKPDPPLTADMSGETSPE